MQLDFHTAPELCIFLQHPALFHSSAGIRDSVQSPTAASDSQEGTVNSNYCDEKARGQVEVAGSLLCVACFSLPKAAVHLCCAKRDADRVTRCRCCTHVPHDFPHSSITYPAPPSFDNCRAQLHEFMGVANMPTHVYIGRSMER